MANKKYIISADGVTEVVYLNMNVHASGGKKEINPFIDSGKDNVTSKRNYAQRRKKRRETVKELIVNNFAPGKSSMITLTFQPEQARDTTDAKNQIEQPIWKEGKWVADQPFDGEGVFVELPDEIVRPYVELDDADIFIDEPVQESGKDIRKIDDSCIFLEGDVEEADWGAWELERIGMQKTKDKYCDLKVCNREFKKFIQRMNYYYENFRYVAVMARQENQRWHYHMFCNLAFIEHEELSAIWRNGGVYTTSTKKDVFEQKWKYVIKNMAEDGTADLEGENGYLASRGLQRNVVLRSWKQQEADQCIGVERYLKTRGQAELRFVSKSPEHEGECKYYHYQVVVPDLIKPLNVATRRVRGEGYLIF